jgi:hypothetical protein
MAAGFILFEIIFKRLWGFSTFEHELSHALVALLFFRRIKKFKVTRFDGGYVEYTNGFGGEAGNHFIALGPYFLPTFTLLSVLVRPFFPIAWFPWFDVWIGITFSYQTMNNIEELRRNWTRERFRLAGGVQLTNTDIGTRRLYFFFYNDSLLKTAFYKPAPVHPFQWISCTALIGYQLYGSKASIFSNRFFLRCMYLLPLFRFLCLYLYLSSRSRTSCRPSGCRIVFWL